MHDGMPDVRQVDGFDAIAELADSGEGAKSGLAAFSHQVGEETPVFTAACRDLGNGTPIRTFTAACSFGDRSRKVPRDRFARVCITDFIGCRRRWRRWIVEHADWVDLG